MVRQALGSHKKICVLPWICVLIVHVLAAELWFFRIKNMLLSICVTHQSHHPRGESSSPALVPVAKSLGFGQIVQNCSRISSRIFPIQVLSLFDFFFAEKLKLTS